MCAHTHTDTQFLKKKINLDPTIQEQLTLALCNAN